VPLLTTQFNKALKNIEPTDDDKENAPLAHSEVREVLAADVVLAGWGLKPVLIGSYKRKVSIRRIKDVDLFGRVFELPDTVEPATLLKEFERVLKAEYGSDRVARQARSLQIAFPDLDGLYVDAVPAKPWTSDAGEEAWQLPKRGENDWQPTNPERLGELTTEINAQFNGQYVPVVKLLRQTRRSLMGKKKPGGLTIEIAALLAFQSGDVTGSAIGELYVSALEKTADLLHDAFVRGHGLDDPTLLGEQLSIRGDDADKKALASAFVDGGKTAREALDQSDSKKCQAAKTLRGILGTAVDDQGDQGDQDYVFPMPDDCNLDGTNKNLTQVRPGDARVAGGDRRFG
jgi:Second Messenger Oligonucleotide or Dinucleotide Synthetase domain